MGGYDGVDTRKATVDTLLGTGEPTRALPDDAGIARLHLGANLHCSHDASDDDIGRDTDSRHHYLALNTYLVGGCTAVGRVGDGEDVLAQFADRRVLEGRGEAIWPVPEVRHAGCSRIARQLYGLLLTTEDARNAEAR